MSDTLPGGTPAAPAPVPAAVVAPPAVQPKYPIYIVSKGRAEKSLRPTTTYLERMGVQYNIVVEEPEADAYRAGVRGRVLVLDPEYQRKYDPCMELAPGQSVGSGAARNFAWDHALKEGHARYWCVDDNIAGFYRFHENRKVLALTGAFFRPMEDFVDRYTNVAMAGPHYEHFVLRCSEHPPFIANSRIYSCNLIQTDLPFRWRARYNEDTILSLDLLKAGYCTVLFIAYLQNKIATQRTAGGNMLELYKGGTLEKSKQLVRLHPDVARLVWKWNRWHHHVDYRPFAGNKMIRRPDVVIPATPQDYGMKLVTVGKKAPSPGTAQTAKPAGKLAPKKGKPR